MENEELQDKWHLWFDITRKPVHWLHRIFDDEGLWKDVACISCAQAEMDKKTLINYIKEFRKVLKKYEDEIKKFDYGTSKRS